MQVAKKLIRDSLSQLYCEQEIESISKLIFEKVLGFSRLQVHLNQHQTISSANLTQITEIVNRLIQFEPIQYILGETEFYGLPLKVNPAVLIPRPETEELVDWIIHDCSLINPIILDIGTGSGCIPIALTKNLKGAAAEGWDISADALMVAKKNAEINQVKVNFICTDVLNLNYAEQQQKYDIIVSNPPYITPSEQLLMLKNVVDYEPHVALFVPETDPLIFYRTISEIAIKVLKPGGKLYFEINEQFGNEIVDLLSLKGFKNIILKKDINGKERLVKADWDNPAI
ncbi:MAG TPA: peptide chain release factor N(5)-glutamine methyltransferase [Prolixibacteraceae bacterium]|nr:peptide chain release factor N(5)-glutamine methyltransferase [Prolixibacteraceae bacterium]